MSKHTDIPAQSQDSMPAHEHKMDPAPDYTPRHPGIGKLKGKRAIITGGDSGIGRAVAVLFAREGANVGIIYLEEDRDADDTLGLIEAEGGKGYSVKADIGDRSAAFGAVEDLARRLGGIDILVNNAAQQWLEPNLDAITEDHLRRSFDSNVMGYVFCTQAARPYIPSGGAIINTASVNAFKGNRNLISYSSTRGAITAFSRSIAMQLVGDGIRVNCVAPGPIWTPFIPGTMPADMVEGFGQHVPMGRPGQPWEVATSYLFLASDDASYFSGQTLHPNGGAIVGS